ncbi:MAG: hypothetical protein ACRDTT_08470, partial [Pseudonocardiaceae bacterium]
MVAPGTAATAQTTSVWPNIRHDQADTPEVRTKGEPSIMKEGRDGWWLVITMLLAVALFGTVIALLLSLDRTTSVSESIRTGGLVS